MQINEIILFRKENENISVKKNEIIEPVFLKQVHVSTCNSTRILTHVHKKNKSHHLYINAQETFLSKWQPKWKENKSEILIQHRCLLCVFAEVKQVVSLSLEQIMSKKRSWNTFFPYLLQNLSEYSSLPKGTHQLQIVNPPILPASFCEPHLHKSFLLQIKHLHTDIRYQTCNHVC